MAVRLARNSSVSSMHPRVCTTSAACAALWYGLSRYPSSTACSEGTASGVCLMLLGEGMHASQDHPQHGFDTPVFWQDHDPSLAMMCLLGSGSSLGQARV